jgi:hypothetical protein
MDEIDTRQQEEIESLKRKDVLHDTTLEWMRSGLKMVSFAFTLWVIISSTIIFVLLDKLDKIVK